jgi:1-pyrroline-5-carboxylate dehydrogenase
MLKGFFHVPKAVNEPVKGMHQIHLKSSRSSSYTKMWNSKIDVPLISGSEEIRTGNTKTCRHHIINIS